MSDPRLVTPWDVDQALLGVLRARHVEHLAAYERRRGLPTGRVERVQTFAVLAEAGDLWSETRAPFIVLGTTSVEGFTRDDGDARDVALTVDMAVGVAGVNPRDARHKLDVLTWTAIECVTCRTPRDGDPISGVDVTECVYREVQAGQAGGITLEAVVRFEVAVAAAFTTSWVADDGLEAGGPGGPPVDPYDPLTPSQPVQVVEAGVTKEAIT